ncbi:transposase [Marinibactrum halimedae]|uniref:Transposase n=1 Tax=Marinibactrum halimedae TaxID=1444977 RepID=A0AA37WPR2_9GAMM|nr:transposase [Marinibactrum halimedae]
MREQYKQTTLLQTLGVTRSSYQYRMQMSTKQDSERQQLREKVVEIHTQSRAAAGSRVISANLKAQGFSVGRFKAARLMKEAKIESKQPGKKHSYKIADKTSSIADNHLQRGYDVEQKNRVWCGDVTYVWSGSQWLYLALVIDLFSRRIVGWACSDSPDTELTMNAFLLAYEARGKPTGILFHSDQGCHYTSLAYQNMLRRYGVRQSMSRRGNCWDNIIIERTFRTFKTEWMPKERYQSYSEAKTDIYQFIRHFNHHRLHSYNGYVTPAAAEELSA